MAGAFVMLSRTFDKCTRADWREAARCWDVEKEYLGYISLISSQSRIKVWLGVFVVYWCKELSSVV